MENSKIQITLTDNDYKEIEKHVVNCNNKGYNLFEVFKKLILEHQKHISLEKIIELDGGADNYHMTAFFNDYYDKVDYSDESSNFYLDTINVTVSSFFHNVFKEVAKLLNFELNITSQGYILFKDLQTFTLSHTDSGYFISYCIQY